MLASEIIPPLLKALEIPNLHAMEVDMELHSHPIAKLVRRGSPLSITVINDILSHYRDVNPSFLVTGKGPPRLSKELKKALGL